MTTDVPAARGGTQPRQTGANRIEDESDLGARNRRVFSGSVGDYVRPDGWTDPGERECFHYLSDRIRGGRMLDVGVGAGRTAWLLPLMTDHYRAIDYSAEMVAAAQSIHPNLNIGLGDARNLREFQDGSFDFVMFSFNGLDALGHDDRQRALDEFHRVLAPSGILMFSTLDMTGVAYEQRPWQVRDRGTSQNLRSTLKRGARFAARAPRSLGRYRRTYANWNRLKPQIEDHGAWGMSPLAAHEFGLLVHYTTPAEERQELARHGFAAERMVDDNGRDILNDAPAASKDERIFFHVIATRD